MFVNAVAALALIESQDLVRARRILDAFMAADPPVGGNCAGGYHQHRDITTGEPVVGGQNDFWLGDVAWLLTAFRQYRSMTMDPRYDDAIQGIFDWVDCLWQATPRPGIYAGYTKDGAYIGGTAPSKHAEGTIDLIGALNDLDLHFGALGDRERAEKVTDIRNDLKTWIDENVWEPNGDCFERGSNNENTLPLDHVTWGLWALIDMDARYVCLLAQEAEPALARTLKPWVVDDFGPTPTTWRAQHENDNGMPVSTFIDVSRVSYTSLDIDYGIGTGNVNWALLNRDAALNVTPAFGYHVGPMTGDATNAAFEIKLYGSVTWKEPDGAAHTSCASVINTRALSAAEIEPLTLGWGQFEWFQAPSAQIPVRLDHISRIEFAVSSVGQPRAGSLSLIAPLTYVDVGVAGAPIEGFADSSSQGDVVWVEGTSHMALSYCLAGDEVSYAFYMGQLERMFVGNAGLPSFLSPGSVHPPPSAVSNGWYVLASRCSNPFDFD